MADIEKYDWFSMRRIFIESFKELSSKQIKSLYLSKHPDKGPNDVPSDVYLRQRKLEREWKKERIAYWEKVRKELNKPTAIAARMTKQIKSLNVGLEFVIKQIKSGKAKGNVSDIAKLIEAENKVLTTHDTKPDMLWEYMLMKARDAYPESVEIHEVSKTYSVEMELKQIECRLTVEMLLRDKGYPNGSELVRRKDSFRALRKDAGINVEQPEDENQEVDETTDDTQK